MRRKQITTRAIGLALMVFVQAAWCKTIYVDAGAAGTNNGASWANAYVHLQDALAEAVANDEIRVAAGIYTPDQGAGYTPGDREASFVLINLVRIVGGFPPGGGTLEQRDWEVYETVLSGDLNGDDDPDTLVQNLLADPTRADNSYNIIFSNLCGPPTLLDGLIITGGQANGAGALGYGGGWYNITNSSPTLINCTFTRNAAQTRGGAWYNEGANCKPTLTNITFTQNFTANRGGAVAMLNTGADAKFDSCQFSQNRAATHGGSVYLDKSSPTILNSIFSNDYAANGGSLAGFDTSSPAITSCTFESNTATTEGGAIWLSNCQAKFHNCSFAENSATRGGACYFSTGRNLLFDSTFKKNESSSHGGAIYTFNSTSEFSRCSFSQNFATGPQSGGGAIYNQSGHPKLISCKFVGNYCPSHGGAICNAASSSGAQHAHMTAWNCIFSGNFVTNSDACGGAVANLWILWIHGGHNNRYTYVTFINSTFYGNTAVSAGGGIYTDHNTSQNTLRNCILWGNADTAGGNYSETAQIINGNNTVRYSCIQGLTAYAGNGNIGDDPLFVDPLGPDWIAGTLDDNLRLSAGSPCIDAGSNSLVPGDLLYDLDGNPRILDGLIDGAAVVDMGAYEYDPGRVPYFADAALKEAVEEALGIADPNCEEMLELTTLSAVSRNITSLIGLEYALNLTSLNLTSNKVDDLSPLEGLPLVFLYLGGNSVGEGDWQPIVNSLTHLRYLYLHSNGLTDIPNFCEQTSLERLYLYNNDIADLCPLAKCLTTLRMLRVYGNPLQSVEWFGDCVPQIEAKNPRLTDFQYDPNCNMNLLADINGDCVVDIRDFALIASEWMSCDYIYQELCP